MTRAETALSCKVVDGNIGAYTAVYHLEDAVYALFAFSVYVYFRQLVFSRYNGEKLKQKGGAKVFVPGFLQRIFESHLFERRFKGGAFAHIEYGYIVYSKLLKNAAAVPACKMDIIRGGFTACAKYVFLTLVGTEQNNSPFHHGAEILFPLKAYVAGPRGYPSFVSKASASAVVYNVYAAGIQRKMAVGYSFCANHDNASLFAVTLNSLI